MQKTQSPGSKDKIIYLTQSSVLLLAYHLGHNIYIQMLAESVKFYSQNGSRTFSYIHLIAKPQNIFKRLPKNHVAKTAHLTC